MGSHSYADETWLLFVREEKGFVFTAVVTQETHVIAEVRVDETTLKQHVLLQLLTSNNGWNDVAFVLIPCHDVDVSMCRKTSLVWKSVSTILRLFSRYVDD